MRYSKTTSRRDQVYIKQDQEENQKMDQKKTGRRDYITLKNRITKAKQQNEEELLQYYTTEKYNEYFRSLSPIRPNYSNQMKQEIKELQEMIQAGHNVCVFGRGSKIELLKGLHNRLLSGYHTFEINGYLPSMTQKKIYTHFGGFLMDVDISKKIEVISIKEQSKFYKETLSKIKTRVVVLLHSIDGSNLMSPDSQQKLADLFDCQQVQLICSLDSIKMVMNWSPITLQRFKFLFFNIDTKQPYIQELKYRSLKSQSRESTEESFMYVWQSLSKNQKQVVKFIAGNALKNIGLDQSEASYFTFADLLQVCIEEIVLSSDNQLRQNLLQLLDHKVILQRTDDKRNKKIYLMKYEKRTLEKIMDMKID